MAVTNNLDIEIKAASDKAVPSLDAMISKLNEVNKALNSINPQSISNIASSLKGLKGVRVNVSGGSTSNANNQFARTNSLLQTLTATSNRANSSFLNLNRTMFKLAATWGMFYASAYPFIKLLNKAWDSAQTGMDYVETYNYFSVTMDKLGKESADAYANGYVNQINKLNEQMTGFTLGFNGELFETFNKNLGADAERLLNYQARIGAVTNAVGLMGEASLSTQKALSMLSQDLSSLTNTDLDSVMTNLQSGLIGQSRSLYKFGIDITNATLKTYAYEHGITKAVSAMTQAEKMQLRVLAILDQSKVAWGDMANTVNSVANQYRIFGQSVNNLSRVLGNLFLPIVSKVLPYVNALLISLRQIFTMLGFKLYGKNWLSDVLDGISSGYSGGEIVDGLEDIEDAADGATKSAKKLKQAVMGFDELNIINPNTSGGSGSGAGGGGFDLSGDIADALANYESIWDKAFKDAENKAVTLANRIMSYIRRGNFEGLGKWISDNLASQLNSIDWNRVYEGAKKFGTGLAQFLNGLIQPSTFYAVGRTVANSLNTAIYTALAFGKEFDFKKLGDAIGSYWNGIFENFDFSAFGETIGIWLGGITKTIATAIKKIKWDKLFDGIKEGLNGFFRGLAESGVTIGDVAIVLGALTIKKILKFAWGAAAIKAISQTLAKGLAARIGIDLAADATLGTAIAQGISVSLSSVPGKLKGIWAVLGGTDEITNETITLSKAFSDAFSGIATKVVGIGSVVGGVTLAVHEFFDMWENGWDLLSEILKDMGIALGIFGGVMLGLSGPVGAVIGAIAAIGSTALIVAHDQIPDVSDAIKNALSNPGGVALDELTSDTSEKILSISDSFNTLAGKLQNNEQIKQTMEDTATSMLTIQKAMDDNVISVEDGVAQIKEQFSTLLTATQTYYEGMATAILSVYGEGGAYQQGNENAEKVAKEMMETQLQITEEMQEAMDNYLAAIAKGDYEEAWKWLKELTKYSSDDITSTMKQAKKDIENVNIDWSKVYDPETGAINEEAFKTEIAKVVDAVEQSKESLDEANNGLNAQIQDYIDTLDKMIADETDATEKAALEAQKASAEALIQSNNDNAKALKEQITQMGVDTTDAIQTDFLGKIKDALSSAETDKAAKEMMGNMSSSMDMISGEIETQMSVLGADGAGWGREATQKIADSIFDEKTFEAENGGMVNIQNGIKSNWQTIFDNTVAEVSPKAKAMGEGYAKDTLEGYSNHIEKGVGSVTKAIQGWMSSIDTAIHDSALEFGSPSKRTGQYAEWTIEGFNNTIDSKKDSSAKSMGNWANAITKSFIDGLSSWKTQMDSWFNNDVLSWFSGDKWSQLGNGIKSALLTKWNEIRNDASAQWTVISTDLVAKWKNILATAVTTWAELYTTIRNNWSEIKDDTFSKWLSIRSDLTGYWQNITTDATITWTNLKSLISTKWTEISDDTALKWAAIKDDLSIKFLAIKTEGTNNFNALKTNTISAFNGIKTGIKAPINGIIDLVEGLMNKLADGFNSIADAIKDLTTFEWTNPLTGTTHRSDGISLPKISHISIPRFALGGFPEDGLFFANHNEMVGQFTNGQNVVANNEQIVEGIRYGVQAAVQETLAPYLRDIANNTSETAQNTDEIKRKPTQTLTNRQIAHANNVGQRSLGLKLRTT